MGIKPVRKRTKKKPPKLHIKFDGGVSYNQDSEIADNQCAHGTQNIWFDGKRVKSRPGLAKLYANSLGSGQINGFMDYRKKDGSVITLLHWGTGLYTQSGANQPVLIYSSLANAKSVAYVDGDYFFLLDGTNFICYDGTTVADVAAKAHIPTITQQRKPDGSVSTAKEALNLGSNSFIDSFTSDGTTLYKLSIAGLTSIDEVEVNDAVVTTGFTTDLTAGTLTFSAGPAAPGGTITDNVKIKATKAGMKDFSTIKKCKSVAQYQDRTWLAGNPDFPATVYRTGIVVDDLTKSPFYFPDNVPHGVGSDSDPIRAMIPHDSSLIVFKEHSTHRADPSTGAFEFAWNVVNYSVGCDMPYTVQIINNNVVFGASYKGICILRSYLMGKGDERSIDVISTNINGTTGKPGLLDEQEGDLQEASSLDDGQRYWVCVKDKAWVWDYTNTPYGKDPEDLAWWAMTNINAHCWLLRDRTVYFGDRTNGLIVKLTPNTYNDFGQPINKVIKTKKFNFGFPEWEKDIPNMWLIQESGTNSVTTVKYYSDTEVTTDTSEQINTYGFDFDNLDYDNLNYDALINNTTIPLRPDARDTVEFQIELSNNTLNQNLSVIGLSMEIDLTKEVF